MKNNTIKKLLPSLYICLFTLALAGCNTTKKGATTSNTQFQPETTISDKDSVGDGTTEPNADSIESTTTEIDKDSEKKETPTETDKVSPDSPVQNTEELQKLVKKVEANCTIIKDALVSSKEILDYITKSLSDIRSQNPKDTVAQNIAINAWFNENNVQKTISDCSANLQKTQEANTTLQGITVRATGTGKDTEEVKNSIAKAQTNFKATEANLRKIQRLNKKIQELNK